MDKIVERLEVVQERLNGDEYGETVDAIGELRTAVTAAAEDQATEGEFRASLELSNGVAGTMCSMADAVRAAQERIDGRDPKPPEVIEDPDPEALEPARLDPVDPAHGRGTQPVTDITITNQLAEAFTVYDSYQATDANNNYYGTLTALSALAANGNVSIPPPHPRSAR